MHTYYIPGLSAALILITAGILMWYKTPLILAEIMIKPSRQPPVKNPGDYGMEYEDVKFRTDDGVEIAAWLIIGKGDGVIILGHPVTFTRYGHSLKSETLFTRTGYNRDVELLPAAKHLIDAGYSVLMYDQRNHGESGSSPQQGLHYPPDAFPDVIGAVKFVSEHPVLKNQNIGLLSYCQSSLISMVAMSREPHFFKDHRVRAMTAIQPIYLETFYRKYGVPEPILSRIREVFRGWGISMEAQDPIHYAAKITIPTLFVQGLDDPWSDPEESKRVFNAIPTEKKALYIKGEKHRFYAYNYFNENPGELIKFMDKYLRKV